MLPEYDFSGGVRGKYATKHTEGLVTAVLLEPDVARAFRTSRAVNRALRAVIKRKANRGRG
jgi:hypothetical protein